MMLGAAALLVLAWRFEPVAAIALVAAGFVLMMAGMMAQRGPLAALVDMGLAYVATLRGIIMAMRGRTFTVWAPAKSRD